MARRRLYCLENRFKRNPALKEAYVKFMDEYEQLGHMKKAEPLPEAVMLYYIPHHAVERKFRVVFDASAKTSNGKSLNELQYVDPRLQRNLIDIVLNFRTGQYALSADICKMFRQIQVPPQFWDLQRITMEKGAKRANSRILAHRSNLWHGVIAIQCRKDIASMCNGQRNRVSAGSGSGTGRLLRGRFIDVSRIAHIGHNAETPIK